MSKKARRVSFSPDGNYEKPIFLKDIVWSESSKKRMITRVEPKDSAMKLLSDLKTKVGKVICLVSKKSKSSPKVSSSSNLNRSRSLLEDSHRAQALEDCIQFLNSSSNSSYLKRTNSVSSNC